MPAALRLAAGEFVRSDAGRTWGLLCPLFKRSGAVAGSGILPLVAAVCCCLFRVEFSAASFGIVDARGWIGGSTCLERGALIARRKCDLCCELEYMRALANTATTPMPKAANIRGTLDGAASGREFTRF